MICSGAERQDLELAVPTGITWRGEKAVPKREKRGEGSEG